MSLSVLQDFAYLLLVSLDELPAYLHAGRYARVKVFTALATLILRGRA
jgi:hypothetical protein